MSLSERILEAMQGHAREREAASQERAQEQKFFNAMGRMVERSMTCGASGPDSSDGRRALAAGWGFRPGPTPLEDRGGAEEDSAEKDEKHEEEGVPARRTRWQRYAGTTAKSRA